jgi:hypothetical protein
MTDTTAGRIVEALGLEIYIGDLSRMSKEDRALKDADVRRTSLQSLDTQGVKRLLARTATLGGPNPYTVRMTYASMPEILLRVMETLAGKQFDMDDAMRRWQRNRTGFEALKSVAKHVKAKLVLLSDPLTAQRDPRFAERQREFKQLLREANAKLSVINQQRNDQQRRIEAILAERDQVLTTLDPNYRGSKDREADWFRENLGIDGPTIIDDGLQSETGLDWGE